MTVPWAADSTRLRIDRPAAGRFRPGMVFAGKYLREQPNLPGW